AGTLYISDTFNNEIRKYVLATGEVTTLAGHAGFPSTLVDGQGANARFAFPHGLALDGAGNLYVADNSNNVVRKIVIDTADVSTFVGGFETSADVASDGANLYVVDGNRGVIVRVGIDSRESTVLAGGGASGADGVGPDAGFNFP